MFNDPYYPKYIIDWGRNELCKLCHEIERTQPKDLDALYKLTHAAALKMNELQMDLYQAGSPMETLARIHIASEFAFIAASYGFKDADPEQLIAPREW